MTRWASVDLGSNTFRLLVAEEAEPGALRFVELRQAVVRLAEGLVPGGRLLPAARKRAERLLVRFRTRLDELGVERRVGVLAAAGRRAADGTEFAERASELLGARVRIVPGEEEARLSLEGALSLLQPRPRAGLFLDIGGGSTEVVAWRPGGPRTGASLEMGVVSLWESVAPGDPPSQRARERMRSVCGRQWARLEGWLGPETWSRAWSREDTGFVATAGTPLTVAAEALGLPVRDSRALTGARLPREVVGRVADRFWRMTREARSALPSVEPGREDVILAGMVILETFMERYGVPEMIVSDGGLVEGVLLEAVARVRGRAGWLQRSGVREASTW